MPMKLAAFSITYLEAAMVVKSIDSNKKGRAEAGELVSGQERPSESGVRYLSEYVR